MKGAGLWDGGRGGNLLDGGDPLYGCYACADGKFLALGAIEAPFRAALIERLALEEVSHEAVAARIATRPRDEWVEALAGGDCCAAPVLDLDEAPRHPHHVARGAFGEVGGVVQPLPAPRFDGSSPEMPRAPRREGEDSREILAELGYGAAEIDRMMESE